MGSVLISHLNEDHFREMELIFYGITAVATLLLAAIAIWQERFKPRPKLDLKLSNKGGVVTKDQSGNLLRYYHIVVENRRKWVTAQNVRIMLKHIVKKDASGDYRMHSQHNSQLTWSPAFWHAVTPNIKSEDLVD